jgi:hypothetical protein
VEVPLANIVRLCTRQSATKKPKNKAESTELMFTTSWMPQSQKSVVRAEEAKAVDPEA